MTTAAQHVQFRSFLNAARTHALTERLLTCPDADAGALGTAGRIAGFQRLVRSLAGGQVVSCPQLRCSRPQFAPISNQETRVPSGAWSDFKELVRTRTDIVQLVGERVALQSRRGGRELVGLCPFHDDHDPSLRVDAERQSYKCWACGEGGDCFAFVQKIENVEFRERWNSWPRGPISKCRVTGEDRREEHRRQADAQGAVRRAGLGRERISHVSAHVDRRGGRPRRTWNRAASRGRRSTAFGWASRRPTGNFYKGVRPLVSNRRRRHDAACHGAADCRTCRRERILRLFSGTRDVPHPRPFGPHCCVWGTRFAGCGDQRGEICQQRREPALRQEPRGLRFRRGAAVRSSSGTRPW